MEIKIINGLLDSPEYFTGEQKLNFIYPALLDFKRLRTSVQVAYNIVKSIKEVERAIKEFTDTRLSICESLCDKDENDKPKVENRKYVFSDEGQKEFNQKFQQLLNTEITLNIWPVDNEEILAIKDINITTYETLLKHGFIKESIQPSLNGKADKGELVEVH